MGHEFAAKLKEHADIETRVSVLGHIQRGGSPTGTRSCISELVWSESGRGITCRTWWASYWHTESSSGRL